MIAKYMAICYALTNIQGLPEAKFRSITMSRQLGLGDTDMSMGLLSNNVRSFLDR